MFNHMQFLKTFETDQYFPQTTYNIRFMDQILGAESFF